MEYLLKPIYVHFYMGNISVVKMLLPKQSSRSVSFISIPWCSIWICAVLRYRIKMKLCIHDLYVKHYNAHNGSKNIDTQAQAQAHAHAKPTMCVFSSIHPSIRPLFRVCARFFVVAVLFGMFHIHYVRWWAVCKRADKKRNHCDRVEHFFLRPLLTSVCALPNS